MQPERYIILRYQDFYYVWDDHDHVIVVYSREYQEMRRRCDELNAEDRKALGWPESE